MERRKAYNTIRVSTPIYTALYSEKVRRNVTWDELIRELLKEKARRLEHKAYFDIRIPEDLYEQLRRLKDRYGLTWDELFMYLIL